MIPIKDPFKTAIDVTGETLVSEIPGDYYKLARDQMLAQAVDDIALKAGLEELAVNPNVENFVITEINRTVCNHDNHIIRAVFYAGLSMYSVPLNLALKCESGSGKSYGTMQTVAYLPEENIAVIGSQSPKVISHDYGVRKDENNEVIDENSEPQKPMRSDYGSVEEFQEGFRHWKSELTAWRDKLRKSHYEVDLRNKTIIFLESVNPDTFKMLKATMSHDNEWIDHKFVDIDGKVHITRLIGAPVLIFNSLDSIYLEEFATRCLTATPSTTQEKIIAGKKISTAKSSRPWEYSKERFNKRLIREYIRRVRDTVAKGRIEPINPFLDIDELFPSSQTRDMRDYNKFLELMPSIAYLNLFQRPIMTIHGTRYVLPTVKDALDAKAIFDSISETTKTGTEQRIISFYWDHVAEKVNGATVDLLTTEYNEGKKRRLSSTRIRAWLERLDEIEWVDARKGEYVNAKGTADNRVITYHPLKNRDNGTIFNMETDLKAKVEAGFNKWLKTITFSEGFNPLIIIPKIDGTT